MAQADRQGKLALDGTGKLTESVRRPSRLLPVSVSGDGVGAAVPVPSGRRGFGVLDELSVGGVLPDASEQDRRARRNPERGDCVRLGRSSGIVLVDPGRAAPGHLGDVCQCPGG